MRKYIISVVACLFIGFIVGRRTVPIKEKEITRYIDGKTIRDTITNIVADTVYRNSAIRYKLVYKTDTIYKDVPMIDRKESIEETIRDWNRTREYNKLLFDNESGKLFIDFVMQYNELQKLSYSFTPVYREKMIVKKRVFEPFVSVSCIQLSFFSMGGGFFYQDVGFRIEYAVNGLNFGIMYKF